MHALVILQPKANQSVDFWTYAKSVFNQEFEKVNTHLYTLALFLHLLCHKLVTTYIDQYYTLSKMTAFALELAKQWGWNDIHVHHLCDEMKEYGLFAGKFRGGKANGKE